MIKAEIIADSISENGHRLTTFVCVFPRIVLSEFNTHRMLSRNSASSRAIPFEKMVYMVQENPFIPIKWMKEHKGMQGSEYFTKKKEKEEFIAHWLNARDNAVKAAEDLSDLGLTKQVCNRLLEPFMWHTVIVTGTEWENFFALRAHPDAEIHIADLAHKMLEAYNESTPKKLNKGEWHIPFGDKMDEDKLIQVAYNFLMANEGYERQPTKEELFQYITQKLMIQVATARCARVSYLNFEGKDDYKADKLLHDRLLQSGHMSPFEHCAQVMTSQELGIYDNQFCGNFRGFIQYRKMIRGENKRDERVFKK